MADLRNGAENVPTGSTPTNANSGGGSSTAITDTNIGGASTLTADTTHPAHGVKSYKFHCVSGQPNYWRWTYTGVSKRAARHYVYLTGYPSAGTSLPVGQLRSASAAVCTPVINDAGQLLIQDSTSSGHAHITTALVPLNQPVRVEWGAEIGATATTGILKLAMYDNTETPVETPWVSLANQNCGSLVIAETRKGKAVSGTYAGDWWGDDAESVDGTSGPIGQFTPVAPAAPTSVTATPGPFNATVGWTPPSYDGDSPITSYTVSALAGGTVVATQSTADGTSTSLVFTGLAAGTSYTFTVHANNLVGSSPESAASSSVQVTGALQLTHLSSDDITGSYTSSLGTTPLCLATAEEPPDDTNGLISPIGGGVYAGKFVSFPQPADNNNWALITDAYFLGGATSGTAKVELFQGAPPGPTGGSPVAASSAVPITATAVRYVFPLTSTQGANITNPADVHWRVTTVCT